MICRISIIPVNSRVFEIVGMIVQWVKIFVVYDIAVTGALKCISYKPMYKMALFMPAPVGQRYTHISFAVWILL